MPKTDSQNNLLTPDPVAAAFNIAVSSANCKNCIHQSKYSEFDESLLWCHGWSQIVLTSDFCSFFKPINNSK